jgi:hypothetical protein
MSVKISNSVILVLVLSFVPLCSCQKDRVIEPIRHESQEVDLNQDLIIDIKISYDAYTWDGIGPNGTGMGVTGSLIPLNNTKILKKQDIVTLFSKVNDTIKLQISQPYSWDLTGLNLVSIKTDLNQYVNPWTINSSEIKDFYYIGFKLSVNDKETFGWMKVKIDKYNGLIEVKETKTSDQGYLIIGK